KRPGGHPPRPRANHGSDRVQNGAFPIPAPPPQGGGGSGLVHTSPDRRAPAAPPEPIRPARPPTSRGNAPRIIPRGRRATDLPSERPKDHPRARASATPSLTNAPNDELSPAPRANRPPIRGTL